MPSGGGLGDADQCAVEADHLHNLPSLLADFSLKKLRYHVEAELPDYRSRAKRVDQFTPHWEMLEAYLQHETVQ